jgi:hypothetical protein
MIEMEDPELDKSPEYGLWLAVLANAVTSLTKGPHLSNRDLARWSNHHQLEAYQRDVEWILDDGIDLGSFRWVCLEVGVEPEPVRNRVMGYIHKWGAQLHAKTEPSTQ